jgi:hypothetical protein
MVDRTKVDVHAMTKIHIYVVRMYVLSVHVQYGINIEESEGRTRTKVQQL